MNAALALASARVVLVAEPQGDGIALNDEPNAPMTPREYIEVMVLPTLLISRLSRKTMKRVVRAKLQRGLR